MVTGKDLVNNPDYWLTKTQIEVFNLLNTYMQEHHLTQKQVAEKLKVSPSYVSQILNGNFNFTISKLIELALLVGKAPVIQFITVEETFKADQNTQIINRQSRSRGIPKTEQNISSKQKF
ncbi:helix-turn-helix domain-containing protein [Dyadobacter chenhuakuii]|uniref:Helix-turn-helix domain-containing protein n=1 Tax=Dyadobacter chenhuakuii TaxID=2909339 RepID=A0ABY4XGD3_9BACT|nr:helix-turn-helix transcriptional regulator [Dyadobacter chenhuakuii]MCF2495463.1 helix-turn-helix domain-containing protein [Dyadobacter chenhuakuii]USJ29500.1 helix-turn-helix domain-containing protein [Dyadobacter chenhuakuii]